MGSFYGMPYILGFFSVYFVFFVFCIFVSFLFFLFFVSVFKLFTKQPKKVAHEYRKYI